MRDPKPVGERLALRPRHELDAMVANIELTLISIVQGVALYFLTDSARPIFVQGHVAAIPNLLSGVLIILLVWTRTVLHAFTVIRWPLELGHNFCYVLLTLFEALLFTQLDAPAHWYALSALFALVVLLMTAYELRMYAVRRGDSAGPAGVVLLDILERDHLVSLRVISPALLLAWGGAALAVWRFPGVFLEGGWHVALGVAQALGLLAYLGFVWRFFRGLAGHILAARREWDEEERPPPRPSSRAGKGRR